MRLIRTFLNQSIQVSLMLMASTAVFAAPNAGELLQQQQPSASITPQPAVHIDAPNITNTVLMSDTRLSIGKIIIQGNQQFSASQLHSLVAEAEGKILTFNELNQLVERITKYYHDHGYAYSRAYLPEQTLSSGVIRINVLEAIYGKSVVNNESHLKPSLVEATLAPLKSGEPVNSDQLQYRLMLLNRLSGINLHAVLSPGAQVGESQLTTHINDSKRLGGYLGIDNFGNQYTGETRGSATISAYNMLGLGDELSLSGLTAGSDLNYGRVSYAATLNGAGTRLAASYASLDYKLGDNLKALGAEGKAKQTNVTLNQLAWSGKNGQVLASLSYDYKQLEDDITANEFYKHRDIEVVSARLDGTNIDSVFGGGLTQYGIGTSFGQVDFKNADARELDSNTAKTAGHYHSVNASLSRLQNLGRRGTQGYVGVYGQYSPYNLDSAEQFLIGGPANVRGYKPSVAAGSSGYYATAELRQPLYRTADQQVGGKLFVDTASVKLNAKPWDEVTGDNTMSLHSFGLGLNWESRWHIKANAEVAFPFGDKPAQLGEQDNKQYWLSLTKTF